MMASSSLGSVDARGLRIQAHDVRPVPAAVWDVVPGCTIERSTDIAINGGTMAISPDGSVLVDWMQDPTVWWNERGSHFRALPGGDELGFVGSNACSHCSADTWSMSDDASLAVHLWYWTGYPESDTFTVPGGAVVVNLSSNVPPAIAPNGLTVVVVVTDAPWGGFSTYEESASTVYSGGVFTDVFDGVTWGFIDDARVLVSHYEFQGGGCDNAGDCDDHLGTDIVELDGTVVQSTTLPDVRRFQRIGDTEILVSAPPLGCSTCIRIEQLWSLADGGLVAAAAIRDDLVVTSDGLSLVVHRWR